MNRVLRAGLAGVLLVTLAVTGCSVPETNTPAAPETVQTTPATALTPAPTGLEIPSIELHTDTPLIPLGLDDFKRLEVPEVDQPEVGGWFAMGTRPGDPGPAVIVAHVDGAGRPGLFARLHEVKPGAEITVTRADGSTVAFTATRVEQFPKLEFPEHTQDVYGDIPPSQVQAQLRLITCTGVVDPRAQSHVDNLVVFAEMTGTTPAMEFTVPATETA